MINPFDLISIGEVQQANRSRGILEHAVFSILVVRFDQALELETLLGLQESGVFSCIICSEVIASSPETAWHGTTRQSTMQGQDWAKVALHRIALGVFYASLRASLLALRRLEMTDNGVLLYTLLAAQLVYVLGQAFAFREQAGIATAAFDGPPRSCRLRPANVHGTAQTTVIVFIPSPLCTLRGIMPKREMSIDAKLH